MLSFMLIDAARRAETAAKEMLACVNGGSASSSEMREALKISKAIVAVTSAFQAGAAATIANCERHGDGGAQVLADAAGLSRREAHGQVRAARTIEAAPAARDALGEGRVSLANAKRLAEAVERTSAAEVDADWELLAKAELMGPEQFAREARRWAAERQPDGGEGDYRQMRARRFVRIWDTDDGMVRFDGQFDPVTGRRIGNRLQADARRQYKLDKQDCVDGANERRSFKQCMADALDNLTANTGSSAGKPFADIAVSTAPMAHRCGRGTPNAPPPPHRRRRSLPVTAAAFTVQPIPPCARPTTSSPCHKAVQRTSTILRCF